MSLRYHPDVELGNIPTRIRLVEIEQLLKDIKSLSKLRSIVCEYLHCGGSEVEEFKYTFDTHHWRGIKYRKRNTLYGSLFSLFDNKPFIIRGFPKIRYADEEIRHKFRFLKNTTIVCEEKLDGTNLGIWSFPCKDTILMGKTREVEKWDKYSNMAKRFGTWKGMFESTPNHNNVYNLVKDGYLVYIELYGNDNQGDFIRYSVPLAFKVIGVVDLKKGNYSFLYRNELEKLCNQYDLLLPKVDFKGKLTPKNVQRLEYELKDQVALDGNEGYVAKAWNSEHKDTYFCKIKTEDIRELCYKMSRGLIPSKLIKSAIRKSKENLPIDVDFGILLTKTYENLLEEQTEELVKASERKIKDLVKTSLRPELKVIKDTIRNILFELNKEDIDIYNKSKILSILSHKKELEHVKAGMLYNYYLEIVLENEGKW